MNLTNEDVQEILRLLDASSFDELQLVTARFRLTLRRSAAGGGGWTQEMQTAAVPGTGRDAGGAVESPAPQPAEAVAPATPGPAGQSGTAAESGLVGIRSPLMGTFYRAPAPGAPAFVEPGSTVDPHTVVGIVETMKLMNSVYAGVSGVVAEICARNGQLVAQDDVLMRVRAVR